MWIDSETYMNGHCNTFDGIDYISEDDAMFLIELEKRKFADTIKSKLISGIDKDKLIEYCNGVINF